MIVNRQPEGINDRGNALRVKQFTGTDLVFAPALIYNDV